jgi:hypothetical protein
MAVGRPVVEDELEPVVTEEGAAIEEEREHAVMTAMDPTPRMEQETTHAWVFVGVAEGVIGVPCASASLAPTRIH